MTAKNSAAQLLLKLAENDSQCAGAPGSIR
jgi:hypothetical protein